MILATILIYFCILLIFSKITSHKANNETFYRGNRRSPWYMVASEWWAHPSAESLLSVYREWPIR